MATLRELRPQRLLSSRDLADKAGVAPGTIVRIGAGEPLPRFVTMWKIAAALGVEPGEIEEFGRVIQVRAEGSTLVERRTGQDAGRHPDRWR